MVYELFHRLPVISPTGRREGAYPVGHFMAGGLTGIIAWVVIFPFDLIKNVYQKDASLSDPKYKTLRHCASDLYRKYGTVHLFMFSII
jgi:hypothetical protein